MRRKEDTDEPTLRTALSALSEGNLGAAEAIAQRLYLDRPDDPAVRQLAGTIALQRGENEQAARHAIASLAWRPDHVPTLIIAGRAAHAAGDLTGALHFFRRATTLAPDRADAAFLMCVTLLELGDAKARSLLPNLLDRFPHDADGWSLVGDALQRAGKTEAALVAFKRAIDAGPSAALHLRAGMLLQSLGRFAEAIESFRTATGLAPNNADAALKLGLCLSRAGDTEGARAEFERAVGLDTAGGEVWFALGLMRQDQRDFGAAAVAYVQALDMRPDLAEAAVNLGICRQETGDIAAAKAAYRRALKIRPDAFGRITQALAVAPTGELWLDVAAMRSSLAD
jgi:tetratricopeptide (TPR) repeat protein